MFFKFRRSVSLGPLRINMSKSGLGMSAGVPGYRAGIGPKGTRISGGIPGTGVGWEHREGFGKANAPSGSRRPDGEELVDVELIAEAGVTVNPLKAAFLGFLFPGLGHNYLGKTLQAVLGACVGVVCTLMILFALIGTLGSPESWPLLVMFLVVFGWPWPVSAWRAYWAAVEIQQSMGPSSAGPASPSPRAYSRRAEAPAGASVGRQVVTVLATLSLISISVSSLVLIGCLRRGTALGPAPGQPATAAPQSPTSAPAAPRPHTSAFLSCRESVERLTDGRSIPELRAIPSVVIDKGVLRNVPYASYRGAGLELNVYGDPESPAGVELGVVDGASVGESAVACLVLKSGSKIRGEIAQQDTRAFTIKVAGGTMTVEREKVLRVEEAPDRHRSDEIKRAVVQLVERLLREPADCAALGTLKLEQDRLTRGGLVFEVTPPTADDAYGGWWVSVYNTEDLERARASTAELREITVVRGGSAFPTPQSPAIWTDEDYSRARPVPTGGTVYVRGYTRKDGTYVQPHTRHAPHSRG